MSFSLRVIRAAERDIASAANWYGARELSLETDFLNEVERVLERIERRPLGFAVRHADYRAALLRRFPYTVYYRIVGAEIRVTAILHQSRGPSMRNRRLGSPSR